MITEYPLLFVHSNQRRLFFDRFYDVLGSSPVGKGMLGQQIKLLKSIVVKQARSSRKSLDTVKKKALRSF